MNENNLEGIKYAKLVSLKRVQAISEKLMGLSRGEV